MQIKILSWNIWILGHFSEISDFLKNSNADIIGLQEVRADDPERDVINFLAGLGYEHIFAPAKKNIKRGGVEEIWYDGPAIFSKHKFVGTETFELSETNRRVAVKADIQIGDKVLHVFNTHLMHTHQQQSAEQEEQSASLIKALPAEGVVVTGDFNATPDTNTIKSIEKVLINSDPQGAPTWSMYPEGCSVCKPQAVSIKLDYIFTSKDLKTSLFKVETSKGSDHLPVSVIVEV